MQDPKLVAASAIALAVTLFAIFSMRPLARRLGLVDKPGGRKRHRGAIPLIGGLCFFIGTLVGLSYLGYLDRFVTFLMAGAVLIVAAGVVDDRSDLSVRSRLTIEAFAVGLVIAATGFYVDDLGQFGEYRVRLWWIGIPITIVAVIGLINAFNMLDGIDGLAGGMAMVSIAAILLFDRTGWQAPGVLLLLQILFAALIPYLCVNLGWPDGRKIFMGDAGSTLIGFLVAWSLIYLSHRTVSRLAPVDVLWCVALPVMDTLAVMYRRIRLGRSPFKPDRQHLHHLLLDAGCPPRVCLVAIVAAGASLALLGYALRNVPEPVSLIAFLALLAGYLFWLPSALTLLRTMLRWRSPETVGAISIAVGGSDRDREQGWQERDRQERPEESRETYGEPFAALSAAAGKIAEPNSPVRALCMLSTLPEAAKIGPIARQLSQDERFEPTVCLAAAPEPQAEQVLDLFDVHPDLRLDLAALGDEADDAASTLGGIERVLNEVQPDVVLVPGYTATAFATTLAAYYHHIPVVRIDAPADTPQPDTAERKVTRALATLHVASSESEGRSLIAEGVPAERVLVAGDVAAGALRSMLAQLQQDAPQAARLAERCPFLRAGSRLLLVLSARPATGESDTIAAAIRDVALQRPDADIVCSTDLIRRTAGARNPADHLPNLHPVEPGDYLAQIHLLSAAHLIVAVGDIQAEVAALGKPVLSVHGGVASSEGASTGNAESRRTIANQILALLGDEPAWESMHLPAECVDGGNPACMQVVEALASLRPATPLSEPTTRDAGSPTVSNLHGMQEVC